VQIVVFDPHRPGHELLYYPGNTNLLMADIAIINKVDSAEPRNVEVVRKNIEKYNPKAEILLADSEILMENSGQIWGKRVLVVEDGPTLTHGEMTYGAGVIAAHKYGAASIVDPRPFITGTIKETFENYPHIGNLLPAMGYGEGQIRDLEQTINKCECDLVLFATPIDLPKLISINRPKLRVRYEYRDHSSPTLKEVLLKRLDRLGK
jgi:predicted GTPase